MRRDYTMGEQCVEAESFFVSDETTISREIEVLASI
jgi:hypothetical protein